MNPVVAFFVILALLIAATWIGQFFVGCVVEWAERSGKPLTPLACGTHALRIGIGIGAIVMWAIAQYF